MGGPGASRRGKGRGEEFRPREPYTHRLRKILEEYPDGSQVLREILQNSDDAKSTEQIFILDHNEYPSNRLLDEQLERYQGPALLAKNNTIFEKRDFQSLLKLADSEKQDQFDKIGVMGVGFNSIYHVTDSPSFITGDQYVVLDPHERYFRGGIKFNFVDERLAEEYPDQFAPFRIPCDRRFEGTFFRYPLRTDEDSAESEISNKVYKPAEILEMFRKFYKNESINCLLFLKYIECISFYELEKGATEPKLLYKIQLKNVEEVRKNRRLIVEEITPMVDLLNEGKLDENIQLETTYVASFNRQEGDHNESNSEWLILNYLDDLLNAEEYFQEKFDKNIRDYKFIPNIGLAVPLNDLDATGRLFCFLPLPVNMPFLVSVHGYFAVNTNRRSLWSPADNEDLAIDALANLKIEWNKYLFETILPRAWVKFLRELPKVSDIRLNEIYRFWPIVKNNTLNIFCKNLIKNVVDNLDVDDHVFSGPSSDGYQWLSLSNGYLDKRLLDNDLLQIIGNIGFPVISVPPDIISILRKSKHGNSLKILSPGVIRTHLKNNRAKWEENAISRQQVLKLFEYILSDGKFSELEDFKMIPLADGTFGTLTLLSESYVYITNPNSNKRVNFNDQLNSNKLIDKTIDPELYGYLYNCAKDGWNGHNINIKIIDEIGVNDLISIISDMGEGRELSMNEINNVIEILKRIAKIQTDTRIEGNVPKNLDGLLIPSTDNRLVNLDEIYFDDMRDKLNEERGDYKISHHSISSDIAVGLQMQTLKEKIYDDRGLDWEEYEQYELLTARIKNILKDYSINSLFKEFLQNADDAEAKKLSIYVDERSNKCEKLFSKGMKDWQGPAIWIYNDAMFTDHDFESLLKLGIGGKSSDDKKIGKFGIGFNCAFNFTDLPSIVSGKYIAFLDPHGKFLDLSKRRRGIRIDFKKNNWNFERSFPDQCHPYKALDCDFTKEFKGTLFRLPLRTDELAEQSKISKQVFEISEILELFNNIQGNKEMLFLRNIESSSLYQMTDSEPQLVWQAKINNINSCRNDRRNIVDSIDDAPTYQLDIERKDYRRDEQVSEIWAICTGGHSNIKLNLEDDFLEEKFEKFSKEKRLKPRGGVAFLCARSYDNSLGELRAESVLNPPELKGEIYSYLPLSISTNLGVHLNGNFSLPSARNGILQSEDFLQADCDDAKWNSYILYDVLPDLHVKLLDFITRLEEEGNEQEVNHIPHSINNLWPIKNNFITSLYKNYGLIVIKKLGYENHKIFWTETDGGRFISLEAAKIFGPEETTIANILVSSGVSAIVKLDKDKIEQLNEIFSSGDSPNFPYVPVTGLSVCEDLKAVANTIPPFDDKEYTRDSIFKLLEFILQDRSSFAYVKGLSLVPLNNGLVGKFGEEYYIGKEKHLKLFPNTGSSKFIFIGLPENLKKIFNDDDFCSYTNIKKFDASVVSILLSSVLKPTKELKWDPNGEILPNKSWHENIWSILNNGLKDADFRKLSLLPLLSVIRPSDMLVRPDAKNPLLSMSEIPKNGHPLFPLFALLGKLKLHITDMKFPESAHADFKKCVVECTYINIIDSLERTRSTSTMKQWFKRSELSPYDYEIFRTFIKEGLATLVANGQKDILVTLPIWPVHSSRNNFIDATSGKLLTNNLPFFSFREDTDFYKYDHESDFNALTKLDVIPMSELEYLEIIIDHITKRFPRPSRSYIKFLQDFLSLENQEIENYLKRYPFIPNQSLTRFVKVDTLYEINVILINVINPDKFLLPELQNNHVCLEALKRMGLRYISRRPPPPPPPSTPTQKDALFNFLLKKLTEQIDNKYHDAVFVVGNEKKLIYASRYVLSAASEKFEEKFCENPDRPIQIEFQQDRFLVFLQLVYGKSFEDAINPMFETEQDFGTYLSLLIDLLKLTVTYKVDLLRSKIEGAIIECRCVIAYNLCKIIECLESYDVEQRLTNFYEPHIRSHEIYINDQLSELRENAEMLRMSRMLQPFL